jgi:hypothetical protein
MTSPSRIALPPTVAKLTCCCALLPGRNNQALPM